MNYESRSIQILREVVQDFDLLVRERDELREQLRLIRETMNIDKAIPSRYLRKGYYGIDLILTALKDADFNAHVVARKLDEADEAAKYIHNS